MVTGRIRCIPVTTAAQAAQERSPAGIPRAAGAGKWLPVSVCGCIHAPCMRREGDSGTPPAQCNWREEVGGGSCRRANAGTGSPSRPMHGAMDDTDPQPRPMHRAWIGTETPCHHVHHARDGTDTPPRSVHGANHDTEAPSRLAHGANDGFQHKTGRFHGLSAQKDIPP
jgi:hypothetical protein